MKSILFPCLICLFASFQLIHAQDPTPPPTEILGITTETIPGTDTLIFRPDCNGPCPEEVLSLHLHEWDFGDCSLGYGPEVRKVYTREPDAVVTYRSPGVYEGEDDDPPTFTIPVDPPVVALGSEEFRLQARLSRNPVPGDLMQIAVTLDYNFAAPGDLEGSLTVVETPKNPAGVRFLDRPILDSSLVNRCGRLLLEDIAGSRTALSIKQLENLENGPSTLLFEYRIPSDLRPGKDTLSFAVRFRGEGAGVDLSQTIELKAAVRGSHDPNLKEADPWEWFYPGEPITYTIHFENIGSASARQVVVTDLLDTLLDINRVELLRVEIGGQPFPEKQVEAEIIDRQLVVTLKGERVQTATGKVLISKILPPSSVDKEQGKGLVEFRVWTSDTLGCFDHIANAAAIVFDNNPAILTPCVVHKRYCDCQEWCRHLKLHREEIPQPREVQPPNEENLVPVFRTGQRRNQIQPLFQDPGEPAIGDPEKEGGNWDWKSILLVVAGLLILLLLVLYLRK